MGLRITTWNVNGIRNPFGYQPWRDKRTFQAMFDILEADIVIFQETKIQRKDLSDDMVLVPGWDCYFSLPRYKKGYSGVVIYTRQSKCAPIRAEEGIIGTLCPPNSSTAFRDLPVDEHIGGYPSENQLASCPIDAATLDSEGRCVAVEFPAFVVMGVYCPANRDETRDDFRLGFLNALDARVRNLVNAGKQVFLAGDLNISREEMDSANAEASMRKQGLTGLEFVSTPARRLFNQLLEGGRVFGERDEGRDKPVMWDICRAFHPDRQGMFTCWEQKVNARPANCGARIDYVLCTSDMKDWFSDSNIQEGLMGSDHCPVYATMKDKIEVNGLETHTLDVMNPKEMFIDGKRQREYITTTDALPLSGRLIPEFSGRRNIRDMFTRKPSVNTAQSTQPQEVADKPNVTADHQTAKPLLQKKTSSITAEYISQPLNDTSPTAPTISAGKKHSLASPSNGKSVKRTKSNDAGPSAGTNGKGQQSLKGFFKPKTTLTPGPPLPPLASEPDTSSASIYATDRTNSSLEASAQPSEAGTQSTEETAPDRNEGFLGRAEPDENGRVHDPVESKESWSKLFTKPAAPRCEGHDEPCTCLLSKKPGTNFKRSFWMCSRPLGPSGAKETNTQWRCHTFIWCSDWRSNATTAT